MNTTRLIAAAALSLAASAPAFAQEATPDTWTNLNHTLTRAQVVADLNAARASGSLAATERGYIEPVLMQRSSAAVKAETRAALTSGEARAIDARVPGAQQPAQLAGMRLMAKAR